MIENFEIKGEWKCTNSDKWFKGSLSYNSDLGAELILHGTLNYSIFDRSSKEIILGKTTDGEVTLVDTWYIGSSTHNPTGVTISKYKPSIILTGHLFNTNAKINFNKVTFKLFNLFNWFCLTGKSVDFLKNESGFTVKYEKISEINFPLNDNCNGKFSFNGNLNLNSKTNKSEINEDVSITLEYLKAINYKQIIDDVFKFVRLFTLFTYEQSYPTSIVFKKNDIKNTINKVEYLKPINCIYKNSNYDKKHKIRLHFEHLVRYQNISNNLTYIIEKWFTLSNEIEDVIFLSINFLKEKNRFSSSVFMDSVRALESYHRSYYNNNRIPGEKFKKLVDSVLEQVNLSPEDNEWLEQRLMGNEPNLRFRIKDLLNKNQNKFTKTIPKISKFCQDATVSRNYYTHYDQRSKNKALSGRELTILTCQIRGILLSALLTDLGIINEHFEEELIYHLN